MYLHIIHLNLICLPKKVPHSMGNCNTTLCAIDAMDPDTASFWGFSPNPSLPTLVADPDVAGYGVSPGTFLPILQGGG